MALKKELFSAASLFNDVDFILGIYYVNCAFTQIFLIRQTEEFPDYLTLA